MIGTLQTTKIGGKAVDQSTAPSDGDTVNYSVSSGKWEATAAAGGGAASMFGDGSDGDATISSNTDLGSSNIKNYSNLTINSGIELSGDSGVIIRCTGTITFGDSSSAISVSEKGGAGGTSGIQGEGGDGGGLVRIFTAAISGTGKIEANGGAGTSGTAGGSSVQGADGLNDGGNLTAPTKAAGSGGNDNGGAGGGSFDGNGGNSAGGRAGGIGQTGINDRFFIFGNSYGAGGSSSGIGARGGGGGAGMVVIVCLGAIPAVALEADGGDTSSPGGGGGGGSIYVYYGLSNSSTTTVAGGTGHNTGGNGLTGSSPL